ncbi:hypothetical protein ACLI4Z_17630 [Natrialbaceae archaeon A-arb3/5]
MHRRSLLAGCALSVFVSGCLDETDDEGDPDTDQTDRNTDQNQEEYSEDDLIVTDDLDPTETDLTFDAFEERWNFKVPDDATPSLAKQIGSSADHHDAVILAESSKSDVSLVVRNADDELIVDTDVDLDSDAYALFRFEEPDKYSIKIRAESVEKTISIDEEFVDCNASLHSVLIRDNEVKDAWESTMIGC